jgi:hypothetical protein
MGESTPKSARDWRNRNLDKSAERPIKGPERPWRKTPPPSGDRRRMRRWTRQAKIGVATLLFLLLTGMLIWASFWVLPPKTACLVLIGAGYQDNLLVPSNVYGWQSLQDMRQLSRDTNAGFFWGAEQLRLHQEPKEYRTGEVWDDNLGNFPEKTVILFFSLHGGSDREGAYLLPADAALASDKQNHVHLTQVLRLNAILDRLKQLPAEKNKLLILEATQMQANWDLGILDNGFVRELRNLDEAIRDVPNLVVISASDVNQRCWVSRYWKRTVFAHQLIEGLRGQAADADNNGRIDALELFNHVRPSVERWVRDNFDAEQTPLILPLNGVGEQRARRMDLTVVTRYTASTPPTNVEELPREAEEMWNSYAKLSQLSPAPSDYAPASWRRFQDLLLRYEDLLWSGDNAADRVHGMLAALGQELTRGQRLDLSSFQNTLTMPEAAGAAVPDPSNRFAEFKRIWDSKPDQQTKLWGDLLKAQASGNRMQGQILRLQFYEYLLMRAEKGLAEDLARAYQIVQVLDDPVAPRPAEVHFLAMVERDRPRTPPPPPEYFSLLQQALKLRVLAERAALGVHPGEYAYSAHMPPWIRDLVNQADRQRQFGQDLLFTADSKNWQAASDHLRDAEALYQKAETRAAAVRRALGVRNRVFARLPYYSQWLGRRNSSGETDSLSINRAESLWKDAHRLTELLLAGKWEWLEEAPPASIEHPTPRSIVTITQSLGTDFDAMEKDFLQYCRSQANADTQRMLRDADDALVVPTYDYALRVRLHTTMWRTSNRLMTQSEGTTRVSGERVPEQRHIQFGQRQGRMAIAVLGQHWFDVCPSDRPHKETFAQVQRRLNTFRVDTDWWNSLAAAGEEIGERWLGLPAQINTSMSDVAHARLDTTIATLDKVDTLGRIVDGVGSEILSANPASRCRRAGMISLLVWQAERTYRDHWSGEDPQAEPYYLVAGRRYLDDAGQVDFRTGPAVQPRTMVKNERDRISEPGRLGFAGPKRFQLTSEQQFTVRFNIGPEKGANVPEGYPVAWLDIGPNLRPVGTQATQRLVRHVGGDKAPEVLTYDITSPVLTSAEEEPPAAPTVEQTSLTLRGYFRGQRLTKLTPVDLFPLADNVRAELPLPRMGSVAVRAPADVQKRFGAGNGAVAIVLDCSGSMGVQPDQPWTKNVKYAEATAALRRVLRKVPRGTRVSLWVFGQALQNQGPTAPDAESTIQQIQKPTPWDAATMLEPLMKRVEYPALRPWNESPIVRTMMKAKDDLAQATGFKTMVVITDGMDNRFAKDAELNKQKLDIPTYLRREFRNAGIMINVVGFKVVDAEEAKAQAQFAVVEELPIPGRFVTVREAVALEGVLDQALRQKLHYWIDRADNTPITPGDGLDVSRVGENAQWYQNGLPPAIYKVRVHTDRRQQKDISLTGGDLLLVDAVNGDGGLIFERGLYSLADFPLKPATEQSGWRAALLQNQQLAGQAVQMLVTLEKTTDRRETILQRLRPRLTWIEIIPRPEYEASSKDPKPGVCARVVPFNQRWRYLAGYPAPAWGIDIPSWPRATGKPGPVAAASTLERPVVKIWWNPDQEIPAVSSIDRGNDFSKIEELIDRPLPVDGDNITIESVRVEEHLVETRPGQREMKPCLVIRASYAECKPVWGQVKGLKIDGQEHRFYEQPSKYTGIFWPVDAKTVNSTLSEIGFVSLSGFKKQAESRKFTAVLKDLAAPATDDARPPQPLTLP